MKPPAAYAGFEKLWNAGRMNLKMHLRIVLLLALAQLGATAVLVARDFDRATLAQLAAYGKAMVKARLSPAWEARIAVAGEVVALPASDLVEALGPWARQNLAIMATHLRTAAIAYALWPVMLFLFLRVARGECETEHVRGTRIVAAAEVARALRRAGDPGDLPIGEDLRLPRSAETQSVLVAGSPGSGKTVLLSHALDRILERGDRVLVYDFKGDFLSRYYQPGRGDLLFNPLDERCAPWSLWNEIETATDIDSIAASLLPEPPPKTDPFWVEGARDILAAVLHTLNAEGDTTHQAIWDAITMPSDELYARMRGVTGAEVGAQHISQPDGKQVAGLMSELLQHAKCFRYLAGIDGPWRVGDWVHGDRPGVLFVANYAKTRSTLRPVLSLLIDLVATELLSLPDDPERRVFFVLDEFGTLQRLPKMVELLTLARSKGGSIWIGIQDIGQLDRQYGPELRGTILNACGTTVSFRLKDPTSADVMSKAFGELEVLEAEETRSMGVTDHKDGLSLAKRRRIERAVLPSELIGLRKLEFYVRFPESDVARARAQFRPFVLGAPALRFREDLRLSQGASSAAASAATIGGDASLGSPAGTPGQSPRPAGGAWV